MFGFKVTAFTILCVGSSAQVLRSSASRNLLENIAGYTPTTLVTDQNAIDQDQKTMETIIGAGTEASFTQGLQVYSKGGNSGSYAKLTLNAVITATPLPKVGDAVTGVSATGAAVNGKVLEAYTAGSTSLSVAYDVSDVQITHSTCRVGGLLMTLTTGCFASNGSIKINNGAAIAYTYTVATDNMNSRTLKTLSTGAAALQTDSAGKYYPYFQKYVDYYGATDYSDKLVVAAFEGKSITLKNTAMDLSNYAIRAREQIAKKTSAYTTLTMVVLGYLERAIENCASNKDALGQLDLAVAYYAGSQEGVDGNGAGYTLRNHADKRCPNYKACGVNRDAINGTSKINFVMSGVFSSMKTSLTAKNCAAAKATAATGMSTLLIPQIQGALRYTRLLAARTNYTGHEISEGEAAAFAAGVLPMIGSCDAAAATTIWSNLRFKVAKMPNLVAVKAAFESTYKCLGITCAEVGGQWDTATNAYFPDSGPCVDAVAGPAPTAPKTPTTPVAAPTTPKAPTVAAAPTAPVASPVAAPEEKPGFFGRIMQRIRKFFKNIFG